MTLSQVARINAISGALKYVVGSVLLNELPFEYNPVMALLAKYLAVLLMFCFGLLWFAVVAFDVIKMPHELPSVYRENCFSVDFKENPMFMQVKQGSNSF